MAMLRCPACSAPRSLAPVRPLGIPSAASADFGGPCSVPERRELPSRLRVNCGPGPRLPLFPFKSSGHVSRHPPPAQTVLAPRSLFGAFRQAQGSARSHPPPPRPRGARLERRPRGAGGWSQACHPGGWLSGTWQLASGGRQRRLWSGIGSLSFEWEGPIQEDTWPALDSGWAEGGPCDVFVATMPLDSPPLVPPQAMLVLARAFPGALVHQAVILRSSAGECLLFDFRPSNSRDIGVILAALALQPVPGSVRVRRLPRLPTGLPAVLHGQATKGGDLLASAQQFCASWDRGLVISRNDCRHFSRALVQLLLAGPNGEGAGQPR